MPSGPGISLFMNVRRPARAATLAAKRDVFFSFLSREREQRVYAVKNRAHTIHTSRLHRRSMQHTSHSGYGNRESPPAEH